MSVLTSADTRPRLNWHPLVYEGENNALIIYAMNSYAHTITLGGKEKKITYGSGPKQKRFHISDETAVCCIWSVVTHSQYQ